MECVNYSGIHPDDVWRINCQLLMQPKRRGRKLIDLKKRGHPAPLWVKMGSAAEERRWRFRSGERAAESLSDQHQTLLAPNIGGSTHAVAPTVIGPKRAPDSSNVYVKGASEPVKSNSRLSLSNGHRARF